MFREFLVREDKRVNEVPADNRDPKDCPDHADPPDLQGLRVTKGRLVIPEEMDDQEIRVSRVPRVMQAPRGYQERRVDLV